MQYPIYRLGLALVLFGLLAGCSGSNNAYIDSSKQKLSNGASSLANQQIQQIENNPHIPPAAKAAAINQIRSHQNFGPGKP
ncbi:hypothetical protein CWRG_02275 [Chthonomonas calidirosea]|uniref:Lipoprotein n=1 Tax=Chthonomonas calidirosea (strain DSM 23976 / ICMP 18418 / T49) TaxID=1303518 RepID=S0EV60_CHTCT|nr:hypothetical protein [Chthonomonas calidirosea]CCW35611.1 hypothetical protein CCALI_01798 [Chthonomonas calidirosea T49]CEK18750.1 hypothetical protein CWRG_02275 [Chthonomonas calidirosea]CEK18760.1 hypothetical protein CP488_02294 [Chthonomonas calidirosea]CEK19755.1 hypothetical protein CTKA_02296 [Chthonomonas calidirosea]